MQDLISSNKDSLDVLIRILLTAVPIVLTWFVRTYVKGTTAEKNLAAIVRLSNSAIDFVENLDKRGDLDLPPDIKKGEHKLKLATNWLEDELKRIGVSMTDLDAQKWIASEFQRRIGDVRPVKDIAETTRVAVDLVLKMEQDKIIELPPNVDRIAYYAGLSADWVLTQLSTKNWTSISREEVLTWTRAELVGKLQVEVGETTSLSNQLAKLAKDAVGYVAQLKANNRLVLQAGAPGVNVEADVAAAWLLTKTLEQGLPVTSTQVADAISNAFKSSGQH